MVRDCYILSVTDVAGTISYVYDENGNVLKVTDENGSILRTYDELNRVKTYTDTNGYTIQYTYNAMGALKKLTYPDGGVVEYHYYDNGKLKSVTDQQGDTTSYEYDGNGLLVKQNNANHTEENYTYDKAGRLLKQTVERNKNILSEISYTYDEAGNIVEKQESIEPGALKSQSIRMTYDEANRLKTYNGQEVKYDLEGNMIYGPDANGEMTAYEYNCRNELVRSGDILYTYDAEGNRSRQENVATGEVLTYATDSNSELPRVLQVREDTGNSEDGENSETITYVYGNGLLTQGEGQKKYQFHYNNIGSTILLTDKLGEEVQSYSYGPYGELLKGDRGKTAYLYNGKYGVATDANGLYYMRARYYNVSIKRFLNQDVVNGAITNSQSLNKFSYVQGNPISLTDPFGLSPSMTISGMGHAALNLLGVIPGFDVCDAINAAWYLYEGDYANAAISTVAILPALGSGISSAMKWAGKGAAKANFVKDTMRLAGNTGSFLVAGAQGVLQGNKDYVSSVHSLHRA